MTEKEVFTGNPILLRGKPLSEVEPDWTEEALAAVYASTEWRADVQARVDRVNALSDEDYERLVNADQVPMLVHPWSGYDPDAFDGLVRMWLPRPVPVPDDWSAKVIAADYPEWPMLYVLFPGERPCIDIRGYIQPATPPDAEQTLDAYASNWAQLARYKLAGCQVSYTPDGGEPLLLTTAARARHPIGITRFNIPPAPGEVRVRVVNFAVDQSGEKRTGEWSDPLRIEGAYHGSIARRLYSDGMYADWPAEATFSMWGRSHKWCTATHAPAGLVPIAATGDPDWVGHSMPVPLAQTEADERARKARYTPPPDLVDAMIGYAREMWRGHKDIVRWRRALSTLGVDDYLHFPPLTAAEARGWADGGDDRWAPVVDAIAAKETAFSAAGDSAAERDEYHEQRDTLPGRQGTAPAPRPAVSEPTKAWVDARVQRYAKARTGMFWREVQSAL